MFRQLFAFLVAFVFFATATQSSDEENSLNEFRSAGMSENGISVLVELEKKFMTEYPLVAGDEDATNKYLVKFNADAQTSIKSMSTKDQEIYNVYKEQIGLE